MIDNSAKTKKRGTQNLNPVDIDNVYLSYAYLYIGYSNSGTIRSLGYLDHG